jgi:hypothetical protein
MPLCYEMKQGDDMNTKMPQLAFLGIGLEPVSK